MNVFVFSASNEAVFESFLADTYGDSYKRQTTFVYDLSIAQFCGGAEGVADTYRRVVADWRKNATYFTEFVISLNFMAWLNHAKGNRELTEQYSDLYYSALDVAEENFSKEEMSNLYRMID